MPHPEDLMVLGGWLFVIGAVVTVTVGIFVVHRYPNEKDPKRNLKRYTLPAAFGALAALIGFVVMVGNALVVVTRVVT